MSTGSGVGIQSLDYLGLISLTGATSYKTTMFSNIKNGESISLN